MSKKKLVFIDIDGIRPEVLYDVLDDPGTNMHRIAGRGIRIERAATVFPAVTLTCQASMFTGTFPSTHGIVGNSWFDRAATPPLYRKYTSAKTAAGVYGFGLFGLPTIILPERPELMYANNDMSKNIKTIYEMAGEKGLSSWNHFNQYSRGADKWTRPSRPEMIIFALCHEELVHNVRWDRVTFAHFFKELRRAGELPDLTVFYESGHDNNSHENGADTQDEYFRNIVDPLFGEFVAELEKHTPLEDLFFIVTSDHGQAQVKRENGFNINMEILSNILDAVPGGGYTLFNGKDVREGDTAVVCTEAGAAQVHLMNRGTNNWLDAPRFEEDLIPVAEAFAAQNASPHPFVDVILVRREMGAEYEVYDNGGLVPLETFFDGKEDIYPDAVRRLRGINCGKSGDLIVLLDYSTGCYYGEKLKAGEHGNLRFEDSLIPLVVAGPDIPDKTIRSASLVDCVPTAAKILGFDSPTAEGVSLI